MARKKEKVLLIFYWKIGNIFLGIWKVNFVNEFEEIISFFNSNLITLRNLNNGGFGWFVMDGYGRPGYQESSAYTKEGSDTNWHNVLLDFTLTCILMKRRRYDKFTIRICKEKTQILIEDRLNITEDLLHIYSIHIQLYLLHFTIYWTKHT